MWLSYSRLGVARYWQLKMGEGRAYRVIRHKTPKHARFVISDFMSSDFMQISDYVSARLISAVISVISANGMQGFFYVRPFI